MGYDIDEDREFENLAEELQFESREYGEHPDYIEGVDPDPRVYLPEHRHIWEKHREERRQRYAVGQGVKDGIEQSQIEPAVRDHEFRKSLSVQDGHEVDRRQQLTQEVANWRGELEKSEDIGDGEQAGRARWNIRELTAELSDLPELDGERDVREQQGLMWQKSILNFYDKKNYPDSPIGDLHECLRGQLDSPAEFSISLDPDSGKLFKVSHPGLTPRQAKAEIERNQHGQNLPPESVHFLAARNKIGYGRKFEISEIQPKQAKAHFEQGRRLPPRPAKKPKEKKWDVQVETNVPEGRKIDRYTEEELETEVKNQGSKYGPQFPHSIWSKL